MSWRKSAFKHAYNRGFEKVKSNKDYDEEQDSLWWSDYVDSLNWDNVDAGPTMEEVRIGFLLHLLTKLKLREAEAKFRYWYW